MSKKKKRIPTVTLGEALSTLTVSGSTSVFVPGILTCHLHCDTCDHDEVMHVPPGSDISCPKCEKAFWRKHVPRMREVPPAPPPPGPAAPKPKLKGLKRYAKVIHEPINPRFCFVKFEDDGSEGKLWKNTAGSLRFQQLIVEPNRDEGMGGWTIVRETPHL